MVLRKSTRQQKLLDRAGAGVVVIDRFGMVIDANQEASAYLAADSGRGIGQPIAALFVEMADLLVDCVQRSIDKTGIVESIDDELHVAGVVPIADGESGAAMGRVWFFPVSGVAELLGETPPWRYLQLQLKAIFDHSADGIWLCDAAGVILAINSASEKLNNIRAEDFVGRHVSVLEHEHLVDTIITGEVIRVQRRISKIQHIRSTGTQILVTGNPVVDTEGKLRLVVVNERDVTQLTRLRQQLEESRHEAEAAKTELATQHFATARQQDIITENKTMVELYKVALKLAKIDASCIVILGDSGTGKGLMTQFIHRNSRRVDKPLIHINCAALPETLLEAELFGYEPGAFTGARESGKAGLFELAHEGTLFLDEIGEMPLPLQTKLLTYLDTFEIVRLGGTRKRRIDCQLIAATNLDLLCQVKEKTFRSDLFHRLNTFTIRIPPLRERSEDIFAMTNALLAEYNARYRTDKVIGNTGMKSLQHYSFPGNVRELQNILKEAVVLCEGRVIDSYLAAKTSATDEEWRPASEPPATLPFTLQDEMAECERRLLWQCAAMSTTTHQVARLAGISQATAFRKLKKYGITLRRPDRSGLPGK
ncbi:MAG: sigma 54-interacting transcriptional regulator [Desulfopila sp.]